MILGNWVICPSMLPLNLIWGGLAVLPRGTPKPPTMYSPSASYFLAWCNSLFLGGVMSTVPWMRTAHVYPNFFCVCTYGSLMGIFCVIIYINKSAYICLCNCTRVLFANMYSTTIHLWTDNALVMTCSDWRVLITDNYPTNRHDINLSTFTEQAFFCLSVCFIT